MEKWIKTAAVKNSTPNKKIEEQPWMSSQITLDIIEKRKNLIKHGNLSGEDKKETLVKLNRKIQSSCRKDKDNFLKNICRDIEQHALNNQTKDLYSIK